SLSLSKLLSCEGESGSARNSSRPRETFTAPAILPLFSTSSASRTSTIRVLPCATMSRACAGVIRGTAALAASIISFKFVVMCAPPTSPLYLHGGRRPRCIPGHNLGSQALAREIRLRKATPATEHLKLVLSVRELSWWVGTGLIPRVGNSWADVRPAPLPVKLVTFLSASA